MLKCHLWMYDFFAAAVDASNKELDLYVPACVCLCRAEGNHPSNS